MRLTFYVGIGKDRDGNSIPDTYNLPGLRDDAVRELSKRFGGITVVEGQGGWLCDEDGKLICEPCLIFIAESQADISHLGVPTASYLRELFGQSCVALSRTDSLVSFII